MPKTHSTYDTAFRQGAVDLVINSGRPLKRVAADLGVSANALRTWRDLALSKRRAGVLPAGEGEPPFADPTAKIRRLQREVEYLRRQREILKKP